MSRYAYKPPSRRYTTLHANALDGYVSDDGSAAPEQSNSRRGPQEALPLRPKTYVPGNAKEDHGALAAPDREGEVLEEIHQRKPYTRKVTSDKYIFASDSSSPPSLILGQVWAGGFEHDNLSGDPAHVAGHRESLVNPRIASLSYPVHLVSLGPGIKPQTSTETGPSSSSINNFDQLEDDHNLNDFALAFDHRTSVGAVGIASHYSNIPDPYDSDDKTTTQPDLNFSCTSKHYITNHNPVFRTPSPPNHRTLSSPSDKMHFTTPTISWSQDCHGYLEPQEDRKFIKIEDEDQFTYSDSDHGAQNHEEVGVADGEDDENEYGGDEGDEHGAGKVWFAGSGRDDWLKMAVDVEGQLRDDQIIEDAGYLTSSVGLDKGSKACASCVADAEVVRKTLGQEGKKLSIKEYVEISETLPHLSDDDVASLIGDHVLDEEIFVVLNDMESERTLEHYEEQLVSTINRLLDAKETEREKLEVERSSIIATIRLIKSNIEVKKKRADAVEVEQAQKAEISRQFTGGLPTPPSSQEPGVLKINNGGEDLVAQAPSKRKRDDEDKEAGANDGIVDMDAPKPKKKRRSYAEIAAEKEQKAKAKEAKEAARIAAQQQKEREKEAKAAEREEKKAAKEAEKERLKAEKAAEKQRNKTPARIAAEAKKEASEREKIAKARGLATGKKGGSTAWKTKAPWEVGRWDTRYQVAAVEQEVEMQQEQ